MKNITLSALLLSSLFCVTVQAMDKKEKKESRGIIIQSSHIEYESDKENTVELSDTELAEITAKLAALGFVKLKKSDISPFKNNRKKDSLSIDIGDMDINHGKTKSFYSESFTD